MKCIICGKSNEKSVRSDCENKKRCKECNRLKTDFYKYKNGKLYSTCIECFNKKVKCEFCNKEFNKTYLSKNLKRCIINHDNNNYTNNTEGVSRIINHNDENHENNIINNNDENNNDENITGGQQSCNRTLLVGPSFCGKTHLLINELQLIRLYDKEKQIHIITRSPNQYEDFELEDTEGALRIVIEEYLEDKSIQDFQNCCVVFDDMLDTSQKLIDPFFTRGRQNDLDVYHSHILIYLKEQLETIVIS